MKWEVSLAKDGQLTMQLNDIYLYSKYRPYDDAARWIENEFDDKNSMYLLIGLGLGYHAKALAAKTTKPIIVYYFDDIEKYYAQDLVEYSNIKLTQILNDILGEKVQILIPISFLKAIGEKHPLYEMLENFKIKQISFQRQKNLMLSNFQENLTLKDSELIFNKDKRVACLIAAGPSLNETIHWLSFIKDKVDIYAVGAAYKVLLDNSIIPNAIITSDVGAKTSRQFGGAKDYSPILLYLSTANHNVVKNYRGARQIIFQQGYEPAEKEAAKRDSVCLDTGGSVATVGFSVIEHLKYDEVVLFGQDLAYGNNQYTHADGSSSSLQVNNLSTTRKVLSNSGKTVASSIGLSIFLEWFNEKCLSTKMKVYNTALHGAKIENTSLITEQEFYQLINQTK